MCPEDDFQRVWGKSTGGTGLARGKSGNGDRGIGQLRPVWLSTASGVAKPGCIVSRWEIGSIVGSPAFFTSQGAHDDGLGNFHKALKFQRLNQVGIEDLPLVLHAHELSACLERLDGVLRLLHGLFGAEDAEVEGTRRKGN